MVKISGDAIMHLTDCNVQGVSALQKEVEVVLRGGVIVDEKLAVLSPTSKLYSVN